MLDPGCWMSSVDIKAAYRSIMISPRQWKFQGLSWVINDRQRYLVDTHICFGSRCAPYIFTQITNFILRCLKRRGFINSIVYLDDFLVTGKSQEECAEAQKALISIRHSLRFYVAWPKCVAPCQKNYIFRCDVWHYYHDNVIAHRKTEQASSWISLFSDKNRATKKQLQRICGV